MSKEEPVPEPASVEDVEKKIVEIAVEAVETIKEIEDVKAKVTHIIEEIEEVVKEVEELEKKVPKLTISDAEMERLGELSVEEVKAIVADIIAKKYKLSTPAGKQTLRIEYDTDEHGNVKTEEVHSGIEQVRSDNIDKTYDNNNDNL